MNFRVNQIGIGHFNDSGAKIRVYIRANFAPFTLIWSISLKARLRPTARNAKGKLMRMQSLGMT